MPDQLENFSGLAGELHTAECPERDNVSYLTPNELLGMLPNKLELLTGQI
jgi:hypothetical protein